MPPKMSNITKEENFFVENAEKPKAFAETKKHREEKTTRGCYSLPDIYAREACICRPFMLKWRKA